MNSTLQLAVENLMEAHQLYYILSALSDRAIWYMKQPSVLPGHRDYWIKASTILDLATLALPREKPDAL
jgi:hypothetical protein